MLRVAIPSVACQRGCKDDEKEKWLLKLTKILNFLKERSVDVSFMDQIITKEWIDNVCSYLYRYEPSFTVINNEEGFYVFQYFIHEVFEIIFLTSAKLNPYDREKLMRNKDDYYLCHAKALEAEYQFLTQVAESFGYSISFGTTFEKHPFFSTKERQKSKENDREQLSKIGVTVTPVPSEFKDADAFFKELEKYRGYIES